MLYTVPSLHNPTGAVAVTQFAIDRNHLVLAGDVNAIDHGNDLGMRIRLLQREVRHQEVRDVAPADGAASALSSSSARSARRT